MKNSWPEEKRTKTNLFELVKKLFTAQFHYILKHVKTLTRPIRGLIWALTKRQILASYLATNLEVNVAKSQFFWNIDTGLNYSPILDLDQSCSFLFPWYINLWQKHVEAFAQLEAKQQPEFYLSFNCSHYKKSLKRNNFVKSTVNIFFLMI